jgi:hypothetical protein
LSHSILNRIFPLFLSDERVEMALNYCFQKIACFLTLRHIKTFIDFKAIKMKRSHYNFKNGFCNKF